MHLFTALGFNTGYTIDECKQHLSRSGCDGGIEHTVGTKLFDKSHIVKNPEWMYKPELLDFDIDYIIVPMRDLNNVALSRKNIGHNNYRGFWQGARTIEEQEKIDAKAFYNFMKYVVNKNLKVILLDFPKIIKEPYYLYKKLDSLIGGYGDLEFKEVFSRIANIDKVHM